MSSSRSRSGSTKACASIAARTCGGVDGLAIVADLAARRARSAARFGIAGVEHGPAIDEDLGADLLGHHLAVQRDGAARRGRDAGLHAQVGRVLGGVAETAPPQDGPVLDEIVRARSRRSAPTSMLGSSPWSASARRNVKVPVMSSSVTTSGTPQPVVDVVVDLAEPVLNRPRMSSLPPGGRGRRR